MFKVLIKTNNDGLWFFELYDSQKKQTITSSDLLFDPAFFKKHRSEEQLEEVLDMVGKELEADAGRELKNYDTVNGNLLVSLIGLNFLKKNKLLSNSYIYLENTFNEGGWIDIRISAVLFHLLQFLTNEGFFNGSSKLHSLKNDYAVCKEVIWLDSLYFIGIEKIDQEESSIRKTIALIKSFQDRELINKHIEKVFNGESFKGFLERKKIKTIAVIPNNAVRRISFNEEIEKYLKKHHPELHFIETTVNDFPERKTQKSTRGLCERLENADKLMSVASVPNDVKNILLIDDVFGSGATMNMVAKKIKAINPEVNIIGFAILSSYRKGFDVINEV